MGVLVQGIGSTRAPSMWTWLWLLIHPTLPSKLGNNDTKNMVRKVWSSSCAASNSCANCFQGMGVNLVCFPCSPTSTDHIHTTLLVLHWQISDESSAKIGLGIGPLMIWLWLSEVHVCWFLNWIYRPCHLSFLVLFKCTIDCGVVDVRSPISFNHHVFCNGVCSLILT